MKMITFIIAALLTTLFVVALTSYGIELTNTHGVNNPLMNDSTFNDTFEDMKTELEGSQITAEEQLSVSLNTTPTTSGGESSLESTPSTAHTFWKAATSMYNLIFKSLGGQLGIPSIILTTITAILVISIVLLIWKLWKTGV